MSDINCKYYQDCEEWWIGNQIAMVQIPALPLSDFVILSKNSLCTSQFPHKETGFHSSIYVIELHEDKMT